MNARSIRCLVCLPAVVLAAAAAADPLLNGALRGNGDPGRDTRPPWAAPPAKPPEADRQIDERPLNILPGAPGNTLDVVGRTTAATQSLPLGYKGLRGRRGPAGPPGFDAWPICVGPGCPSSPPPFSCDSCDPAIHLCDELCGEDPVDLDPDENQNAGQFGICRGMGGAGLASRGVLAVYLTSRPGELCRVDQGRQSPEPLGGSESECVAAGGTVVPTPRGCGVCRFGIDSVSSTAVYAARALFWSHGTGDHCSPTFSSSARAVHSPGVGSCGASRGGGTWPGAPPHVDCPSGWAQLEDWGATGDTFVDARPGGQDPDAFCIAGHSFGNVGIELGSENDHSERIFSSDIRRCCLGQAYRYQIGCLKVLPAS